MGFGLEDLAAIGQVGQQVGGNLAKGFATFKQMEAKRLFDEAAQRDIGAFVSSAINSLDGIDDETKKQLIELGSKNPKMAEMVLGQASELNLKGQRERILERVDSTDQAVSFIDATKDTISDRDSMQGQFGDIQSFLSAGGEVDESGEAKGIMTTPSKEFQRQRILESDLPIQEKQLFLSTLGSEGDSELELRKKGEERRARKANADVINEFEKMLGIGTDTKVDTMAIKTNFNTIIDEINAVEKEYAKLTGSEQGGLPGFFGDSSDGTLTNLMDLLPDGVVNFVKGSVGLDKFNKKRLALKNRLTAALETFRAAYQKDISGLAVTDDERKDLKANVLGLDKLADANQLKHAIQLLGNKSKKAISSIHTRALNKAKLAMIEEDFEKALKAGVLDNPFAKLSSFNYAPVFSGDFVSDKPKATSSAGGVTPKKRKQINLDEL